MDDTVEQPRAAKRVALNMKATPALRARIDAAAKESGLSIAQEVERRLLASMAEDDRAGGLIQGDLLRTMQLVMNAASRNLGRDWWTHHEGWKIVAGALTTLLEDMQPDPLPSPAPFDEDAIASYKVEFEAWQEAEVFPLRERRNVLEHKRRMRRPGKPFTDQDFQELAQVSIKLLGLADKGPKPRLAPAELERWEAEQEWKRRVNRARDAAASYQTRFFGDYNDGERYNGA